MSAPSIRIDVDTSDLRRRVSELSAAVANPSRLLKKIAGDAAMAFRANFRRLNSERSRYGHGFYLSQGARVTRAEWEKDGTESRVVVRSYQMAHKLLGGTVRPKKKYLAIPVSSWAKSRSADARLRDFPGLEFFVSSKGNPVVARKDSNAGPDWVLVRSVTHKPHPEVIPTTATLRKVVENACDEFAEETFGGVSNG